MTWHVDLSTSDDADPFERTMGGRTVHGDVDFETRFITHIVGNLYVGGVTTGLVLPERFRFVMSLYQSERYLVHHEGVRRRVVEIGDFPERHLLPSLDEIDELGKQVWEWCQLGPTLVHCQAGLNRSGLIAAAALLRGGYGTDQALELLRAKRSPAMLCNRTFESMVYELAAR